jgi:uncharacterized protein
MKRNSDNNFTSCFLFFYKRKWFGLILMLALFAVCIPFAKKVNIDLSLSRVISASKAVNSTGASTSDSEQSGLMTPQLSQQSLTIVRLTTKKKSFLNNSSIHRLRGVIAKLESLNPTIKVDSLLNRKTITITKKKGIEVVSLVSVKDLSKSEIKSLKQRIMFAGGFMKEYISPDFKTVSLFVSYKGSGNHGKVKIYQLIKNELLSYSHQYKAVKDTSIDKQRMHEQKTVVSEMPLLGLLGLLILVLLIGLITRNILYSVVLLILTAFNLVVSLALMSLMGWSINLPGIILPILIIVVGSTEAIHVMILNVKSLRACGDKDKSIAITMEKLGLACILTALTTAIGLYSFTVSRSFAVKEFGLSGGTSMLVCGVSVLFFLPLLLAFIPVSVSSLEKASVKSGQGPNPIFEWLDQLKKRISLRFTRSYYINGLLLLIMIIVAASFAYKSRYDVAAVNFFKENHPLTHELKHFHQDFGGVHVMEVRVTAPLKNTFLTMDGLENMLQLSDVLMENNSIDNAYSYANMVMVVLNELDVLPSNTGKEIVKKFSLNRVEKGKEIQKLLVDHQMASALNADFDQAVVYVRYSVDYLSSFEKLKKYVKSEVNSILGPDYHVSLENSGQDRFDVYHLVYKEQVYAILLCGLIIMLLFSIQYRSLLVGFLALLPNVFSATMLLGFMGAFHYFLNPMTIASFMIMLSVGVDFTIHLFLSYRRAQSCSASEGSAAYRAIKSQLGVLFIATVSIFIPLLTAEFSSNYVLTDCAILLAFGILFSFICNILFASSVFQYLDSRQKKI